MATIIERLEAATNTVVELKDGLLTSSDLLNQSVSGIATDIADLKGKITDGAATAELLSALDSLEANTGTAQEAAGRIADAASSFKAIDEAYPVAAPPVEPSEPTEDQDRGGDLVS